MLVWLAALLARPVVQVGITVLGVIPSMGAIWKMFKTTKEALPTEKTVRITCYGWADNDPPSAEIAFPLLHKYAGGVGTYDDPITCAADPRQIEKGTLIYIPRFQKYFIMEDLCGSAVKQDRKKPPIIDLWIGGTKNSDVKTLTDKEEGYTFDDPETVIIHPANNMVVSTTPLFSD